MKTPFWKTYLALAVLAGFGAYIYFVESKRPASSEKPKEKVFTLDKAKVKELRLEPKDGDPIQLVKQKDAWRLTAPLSVAAETGEVESLVSTLESLELQDVVVEEPKALGEFGLETPKQTVSVLLDGASEPLKLLLGDKSPDGSAVYAKLPTRPRVFTIASYLEGSLAKKPFDLRDRDLLKVKRDAVKTLAVSGPEGSYALVRDDKGEWAFSEPLATRAGRWAVDGLLGTLEGLRMESVAAEAAKDLKPFGLLKPVRTLTMGLADGGKKTLEIGSSPAEKKFHAREISSPLVAVIPGALVDDLAKGMANLRAKRLLEVSTYEVEGFDLESDAAKRVYTRSSQKDKEGIDVYKWKRSAPDAKDVDTNKVQDALFKIGSLEAAAFEDKPGDAARYGLDKPAFKLTLRYGKDKPSVFFELGQKDAATWARRSDDQALLKLDTAKADELVKAFKEL